MNIDQLTIAEAKQLSAMFSGKSCKPSPFEIGRKYLIRTVTHIDTGEVTDIIGDFVRLKSAAWIADTGRYHDCLKSGKLNEVEPYPDGVTINTSAIVDFANWNHELPMVQK